ncbi:DUF3027 domain-containing protein [Phaeacidiphilus oryzae]|jgi:hypothetical protein|uniref:DUF3027 domain-containing protein n=1 Tax=Phaeacidiphilus oryzae TaxID=348818 RepID=UPI003899C339
MRSRTPDRLCAEAVELARRAAVESAGADSVGEHQGLEVDGDRVVTHYFACAELAYRGWRWAVTVARASRAKNVTVDEIVLLPGADALIAPQWVPWSERLLPGDLGPGDLLPTPADDPRLEPGWTGSDEGRPAPAAGSAAATEETSAEAFVPEELELSESARGTVADVASELGLGRPRVLSRYGLHLAADRWEKEHGPHSPMAQAAPASCSSCGFLMPVGGVLGQAFGVCANEYSPADGRVVSLGFGCGGHSEAAVMPTAPQPAEPILDELRVDPMALRGGGNGGGSVEAGAPPEELGHS